MTDHYYSIEGQQRPDSPIPLNALESDFDNKIGAHSPLLDTTLQSLLFAGEPIMASDSQESTVELDWATNEESSTNVVTPLTFEDGSSLEPRPIDENKMEILSNSTTNTSRFQFWKTQQQQQVKNLLAMVFYPESAKCDTPDPLPIANNDNNKAGSNSVNGEDTMLLKRSLDQLVNQDDFFLPIKKQRIMSPAVGSSDSPLVSALAINADSLNNVGRFRDYQSGQWSLRFRELELFRQQRGHCCVPHGCKENPVLARWVKRQRYQYKLRADGKPSTMTIERIAALERLGFVWDSHGEAWMERFQELQEYFLQHGSCNVSSSYISSRGRQLSSWVKCQRRQYRMFKEGSSSTMTIERISMLESIGFEWELRFCRNTASPTSTPQVTASPTSTPQVTAEMY